MDPRFYEKLEDLIEEHHKELLREVRKLKREFGGKRRLEIRTVPRKPDIRTKDG